MLMTQHSSQIRRPGLPLPPMGRRARRHPHLPYGKAQEVIMRRALHKGDGFVVRYTREIDTIYKLDAVVLDRERPLAPAVGLQFTTAHNQEKMQSTIDMVRRTGIVQRFVYLEAECPIEEAAFPLIQTLVRYTATAKPAQGIVTAILTKDERGCFTLRNVRCYSIEADRPTIAA
jgi:hypothetical protein